MDFFLNLSRKCGGKCIFKIGVKARKNAQQLERVPAALEEDQGSVHSSQPATPALGDLLPSSGPCGHVHAPGTQTLFIRK